MATWIAHMRIAEELNKKLNLNEEAFLVGNIGPDSGIPNKNGTGFDPPKTVTHWLRDDGNIIERDAEGFFRKYIGDCNLNLQEERNVFLLGYYTHLITDIAWGVLHREIEKTNTEYIELIKNEPDSIWKVVKKDWYGLDFKYLRDNETNIFNRVFVNIETVPDYLDYLPKNALTISVKNIREFYTTEEDNYNKEFVYLKEDQMNKFVEDTVKYILNVLAMKGFLKYL